MRRRLAWHHLPLAVISVMLTPLVAWTVPSGDWQVRWSMATAYVGLALLALTLAVGPIAVLLARPVGVSWDLRRDFGIWAALVSIVHVVIGLQVHAGTPLLYFLEGTRTSVQLAPRRDLFGLANYAGLGAAMVLVLLLVLSNDAALRRVGAARWKALQRSSYAVLVLVAVHGVAYQALENRRLIAVVAFIAAYVGVGSVQLAGWARIASRRRR